MNLFKMLLVVTVNFSCFALMAQTGKHFRVVEIENFLTKKVEKIYEARFPGQPYLIDVTIEPLRNINRDRYSLDEDGLPYFEVEQQYIDEWDDPKVSNYQLLSRVKKINIGIHLPDSIPEKNIDDFKQSVYKNLNLIAGRDSIELKRKNWMGDKLPIKELGIYTSLILFSLLGLWLILRLSLGRGLNKLANKSSSSKEKDVSVNPAPPLSISRPENSESRLEGVKDTLSLRLTDTLKVKSFVQEMVQQIASCKNFPSFKDMLELEGLGKKDPGQLGALLLCFPVTTRKKLFSFSSANTWLEALYHPTEIGPEALQVLEKIERYVNDDKNIHWEELLIRVWKMQETRKSFFDQIDKKDAFSILSDFPRNIAIPLAREAYPGSWGILLETDSDYGVLAEEKLKTLIALAKDLDSDREEGVFNDFRRDKELLQFLKEASVQQEKEVYATLPSNSLIPEIRPPFFRIFAAKTEELDELMSYYSIEDWAKVLFNVGREERKPIEAFFEPKELKVYRSYLISFDSNKPDLNEIGSIRESMARRLNAFQASAALEEHMDETSMEAS